MDGAPLPAEVQPAEQAALKTPQKSPEANGPAPSAVMDLHKQATEQGRTSKATNEQGTLSDQQANQQAGALINKLCQSPVKAELDEIKNPADHDKILKHMAALLSREANSGKDIGPKLERLKDPHFEPNTRGTQLASTFGDPVIYDKKTGQEVVPDRTKSDYDRIQEYMKDQSSTRAELEGKLQHWQKLRASQMQTLIEDVQSGNMDKQAQDVKNLNRCEAGIGAVSQQLAPEKAQGGADLSKTVQKLEQNLPDLLKLAEAGASGSKSVDFVDLVRDKAKSVQQALSSVSPEQVQQLRDAARTMEAGLAQSKDQESRAELTRRIGEMNKLADLLDPKSDTRKGVEELCHQVKGDNFNANTLANWVRHKLPALSGAVLACGFASALAYGSVGTLSPLSATILTATAGSIGWVGGEQAVNGALTLINKHSPWNTGLGDNSSHLSEWLNTDNAQSNFLKQVLVPCGKEVALNTGMSLATMGLVKCVPGAAGYLLKTAAGKVLPAETFQKLCMSEAGQQLARRLEQAAVIGAKNPEVDSFLKEWAKHTVSLTGFVAGQQGLEYLTNADSKTSVGISIGLALLASGGGKPRIDANGRVEVEPGAMSELEKQFTRDGHRWTELPSGEIVVEPKNGKPGEKFTIAPRHSTPEPTSAKPTTDKSAPTPPAADLTPPATAKTLGASIEQTAPATDIRASGDQRPTSDSIGRARQEESVGPERASIDPGTTEVLRNYQSGLPEKVIHPGAGERTFKRQNGKLVSVSNPDGSVYESDPEQPGAWRHRLADGRTRSLGNNYPAEVDKAGNLIWKTGEGPNAKISAISYIGVGTRSFLYDENGALSAIVNPDSSRIESSKTQPGWWERRTRADVNPELVGQHLKVGRDGAVLYEQPYLRTGNVWATVREETDGRKLIAPQGNASVHYSQWLHTDGARPTPHEFPPMPGNPVFKLGNKVEYEGHTCFVSSIDQRTGEIILYQPGKAANSPSPARELTREYTRIRIGEEIYYRNQEGDMFRLQGPEGSQKLLEDPSLKAVPKHRLADIKPVEATPVQPYQTEGFKGPVRPLTRQELERRSKGEYLPDFWRKNTTADPEALALSNRLASQHEINKIVDGTQSSSVEGIGVAGDGRSHNAEQPDIVVDKSQDLALRIYESNAHAKFDRLKGTTLELATQLTKYAQAVMKPNGWSEDSLGTSNQRLRNDYAGRQLLLGEFIRRAQKGESGGVCLEQSMFLKVLLDSFGTESRLVVGNLDIANQANSSSAAKPVDGNHAWVEVKVDGKWLIFDPRNNIYGQAPEQSPNHLRIPDRPVLHNYKVLKTVNPYGQWWLQGRSISNSP